MELCLVRKTGGSLAITLPHWVVKNLGIEAGDKIWIDFSKSWIEDEKMKKNPTLCEKCRKKEAIEEEHP